MKVLKRILKWLRRHSDAWDVQRLVADIYYTVTSEATRVDKTSYTDWAGTIIVRCVPECDGANECLGYIPIGNKRDFIFRLWKDGDDIIRDARGGEPYSCESRALSAIPACEYVMNERIGNCSSDLPKDAVGPGRIAMAGCAGFEITYRCTGDSKSRTYMRVYVSSVVGGASDEDSEKCSLAAKEALERWCESGLLPSANGRGKRIVVSLTSKTTCQPPE